MQQNDLTETNLQLISASPVFGFDNLVSCWVFLRFLQYFGDFDTRDFIGYGLSPDFFEVIVERDPYFMDTYLYLTNAVSVYAGQPQTAISLMDKGLRVMSPDLPARSYFIWRYKGTDQLLFIGDNQAAQASFQTAADWATQSSDPEAPLVARLSQRTADFLATDPNSKPAVINGWMNVLSRAIDDNVRQEAIAQIEALGGKVLVAEDGQVTVRYNPNE
ncbi:hypothetical protein D0962_27930 [Leptolyngbyaceae cyanobacterium CCMR0082]|uniref:Tetratricopeptide repeat protein n=1 Tax=Adonisia turfae CCMR0082 TaxID=2304604 RepID=A0A6M0SDI6_9CYAN|nr:hypothetical protein [Adonisia turfae]NEZ66545.1 hypothetical protein [Adonisia turfae CCMR0082]